MYKKRLYRSEVDCIILGVCGGLGEYFGINSSLVRWLFILAIGIPIYIILALAIPKGRNL